MQVVDVPLNDITIGERKRSLRSQEKIVQMAQSILQIGLLKPILLTEEKKLIAGMHRLEAFRFIGRDTIPAIIRNCDELDARLAEIDENLINNELTALEIGEHLLEREEILAARGERAKAGENQHTGSEKNSPPKTTANIAADVGLSERVAQQRKQAAKNIEPDVKDAIRSTSVADSPSDLLKLARQTPEKQRKVAEKLKSKTPDGKPAATNVHHALVQLMQDERDAQARASTTVKPSIVLSDAVDWLCSQPACDLLFTDPPYSTDVDDIELFAAQWLPLALNRVKDTGRAYVCIGAYPQEIEAYLNATHLPGCPLLCEQILVWTYRNTLGPSPKMDYKLNWQAVLYFRGENAPPLECPLMNEQFSVQDINAPDGRLGDRYHAWQKPDELAERVIRHSTKPGDIILDPFSGTGTHLLAAARLGRIAYGCDQSPQMIEIAQQRGCHYER